MTAMRIALANLPYPESPQNSVRKVQQAVAAAAEQAADLVCFPECYVPGYRTRGGAAPPPDAGFLEAAWAAIAEGAAQANVGVVLGTERIVEGALRATVLVIRRDGSIDGWQDKVQLDPSEDGLYTPGTERRVFEAGPLVFGVAICHEGFRYPETVRWAVRRGARLVFHPHYSWAEPGAEPGGFQPSRFADPSNSFHEKAVLCRAAENTCYVATVNCASPSSPTTSAIANPDGTLLCFQPYGQAGLLVAELDLEAATGVLAHRLRTFDNC
jgi:predicted amidohydrolase